MVNDPIGDTINRLKNAGAAGKTEVVLPFSNMRAAVLEVLKEAGFIASVEKQGKKDRKQIVVTLLKKSNGTPRISGARRISKPGRRLYRGVKDIHQVRNGVGALVLSTPKGIMTDAKAREENVGGEALFEIF